MPTTGFARRGISAYNRSTERTFAGRVSIDDEWRTVGRWRATPPSTARFSVGGTFVIGSTDQTTTGELQIVATARGGGARYESPIEPITAPGLYQTTWFQVSAEGEAPVDLDIEVLMKRTGGTGGLDLLEQQVNLWSAPISDFVDAARLSVVSSSVVQDNDGFLAIGNPSQGTGNSLIAIAIAPGPGFDSGNGWGGFRPPAGGIEIFAPADASAPAEFVQRERAWLIPVEPGTANIDFGWSTTGGTSSGTKVLIGLDGVATSATVVGPVIDNDADLVCDWPSVPTGTDFLVLAVCSFQNNDVITSGAPAGYSPSAGNSSQAAGARRRLTVYKNQSPNVPSEQPADLLFSGTEAAKSRWMIAIPPGSGAPPSTFQPLPSSLFSFELNGADPLTWGRDRNDKQGIFAGAGDNPTANNFTSNFGTGVQPAPNGYQGSWNAAGDEYSITGSAAAPDGVTARLRPGSNGGVPTIEGRVCYVPGSGYGSYQSPENMDTSWPLGVNGDANDMLFVDGSRAVHFSDIDGLPGSSSGSGLFRVGPGADEVTFGVAFVTAEWMVGPNGTTGARNWCTGPLDFHAPTWAPLSSPLYYNIQNGVLELVHRSAAGNGAIDLSGTVNSSLVPGGALASQPINPVVGGWNLHVVNFKIDPSTTDRFVNWWSVDPGSGAMTQVLADTGQRGYYLTGSGTFSGATRNGATESGNFYSIHQIYIFHVNQPSGVPGMTENWDTDPAFVGPNGTMRDYAVAACEGAISPAFTPAQMGDHLAARIGL